MSVLEIRKGLNDRLASMDADSLLKMMEFADFLFFKKGKEVPLEKLTSEQEERLLAAYERRNDVEGKVTHEEFMKKARAWIEE